MATTTRPEGTPNPGAGRIRLRPGSSKAARAVILLVLLAALVLTVDKTAFFFRLAGAALGPGHGGPSYFAALAACAYRRPGLLPVLGDETTGPGFLSAWLAEHSRHGDADLNKSAYGAFPQRAAAKFPDNIILADLGLLGKANGGRDWPAFDPLFFRLAGDPGLNGLTSPALTRAFRDLRLPGDSLPRLLSWLEWRGNTALAGELRQNAAGRTALKPAVYGPPAPADSGDLRSALWARAGGEAGEIGLGENLISPSGLSGPKGFDRFWEFLDMSSKEPFAKGSFDGGFDPLAGAAFRIMGFFSGEEPGRVPCRAGFGRRLSIPLGPEIYLFTFLYRTEEGTERPSFWLADVGYLSEREIVPTGGAWRRVVFIFRNADLAIPEVKPLLRMWGTGTVWFAGPGLYAVKPAAPGLPAAGETLLYE